MLDKYEYNLKLDQMKTLIAENNYQAAAEIADTINWRKIKNVSALVRAGEIYENVERFDEAKDILLMAYDRSPIGRTIIYRLACLAIKTANFEEAKEYYNEFVSIAPHDILKYVLKYELNKAQGSDYRTLIQNLEDLKEQEFSEEWGYELAYMYHQAGMSEKCIEICDEIILYFGDGAYVERALELKMLYQPLTLAQEEIYRKIRLQKEGIVEVRADEELESGEIISETIHIPEVKLSPERFNTQNLQEALQKSMQQIAEATEKETVEDSMEEIKKLVEEIPYLQIPIEKEETVNNDEQEAHIATDQEIDDSLRLNFQELLNEEYDGQLILQVPGGGLYEPQVTGQMTIEEVLTEWERTRRAAAAALQEAEQQKLESAKARALQEAGDIMERLVDVIPMLDSGITPQDLLKEQYLNGAPIPEEKAARMVADMNELLQKEIDRLSTENARIDEKLAVAQEFLAEQELQKEEVTETQPAFIEETDLISAALIEAIAKETLADESTEVEEEMAPIHRAAEVIDAVDQSDEVATEEIVLEEILTKEVSLEEDFVAPSEVIEKVVELSGQQTEAEEDFSEEIAKKLANLEKRKTLEKKQEELSVLPAMEEILEEIKEEVIQKEAIREEAVQKEILPEIEISKELISLTQEEKDLFTYFIPVKGMEEQICVALGGITDRLQQGLSAKAGNLIIEGGSGSGKTVLAIDFVKALQQKVGKPEGKVGKIDAEVLNKKDINVLFPKIAGGCLIIEGAGMLKKEVAVALASLLEQDTKGTLIILEDTKRGIENILVRDSGFASRFSEKISIPIFTNDELVIFAKAYAAENGYAIDEMGTLALYNCISNIQKLDHETTVAEVKEIVDEAIDHVERGTIRKAFSILTSSRYDEEDYVILHEKDFNN